MGSELLMGRVVLGPAGVPGAPSVGWQVAAWAPRWNGWSVDRVVVDDPAEEVAVEAQRTGEAVYLAGAISGLVYGEAMAWRTRVTGQLLDLGYGVLSPMRQKDNLAAIFDREAIPHTHPSYRDPFARDMHDIDRATYVLVNAAWAPSGPSVGTLVELGAAWAKGKYVIVVDPALDADPDYVPHPFVRGAARDVVPTLDEAIDLLAGFRPTVR